MDFDYLFRNNKARDSTMDMLNSLMDKRKISIEEKRSLETLTINCYDGQDIRAQIRGQRYAERIRALTPYTDKVMNI